MKRLLRLLHWTFKMTIRVVLPVVVLALGYREARRILDVEAESARRPPPAAALRVEVVPLEPTDYRIVLETQGTVSARTRSVLRAEVAGRVTSIAEAFHDGGFFEKGDPLVEIDRREFELEVRRLEEEIEQSEANLVELEVEIGNYDPMIGLAEERLVVLRRRREREEGLVERGVVPASELEDRRLAELAARSEIQGLRNQHRLLEARRDRTARAIALSATALEIARLDLERTTILAPYPGRVLRRSVDLGQYVSPGIELASIYAVDAAEVRLPLTNRQLARIDLPIRYRDEDEAAIAAAPHPPVTLRATVGRTEHTWRGTIARTEGAIDTESRQLFVVAVVDDPYAADGRGRPPLAVGLFVSAEIEGRVLRNVHVIPRSALQGADEVFLVRGTTLRRQRIEIAWRDADVVVVESGIEPGDLLCTTPVVFGGPEVEVDLGRPPAGPATPSDEPDGDR